jgi:2-polyprenyl-6-methoxyphenol hydroxylase-like FAD-dependent oxidoreductase
MKSWKGPINIQELIQNTPHDTILRTDICKIKNVTSFPWTSPDNKMIILGDAANATAPNLAQGAGLAI